MLAEHAPFASTDAVVARRDRAFVNQQSFAYEHGFAGQPSASSVSPIEHVERPPLIDDQAFDFGTTHADSYWLALVG
jgi:hypothetical protein